VAAAHGLDHLCADRDFLPDLGEFGVQHRALLDECTTARRE
jgi:hypothetical protein